LQIFYGFAPTVKLLNMRLEFVQFSHSLLSMAGILPKFRLGCYLF
jgi:hypothetical protein